MQIHLTIIGCLFICLALVHTIFPKYFQWQEELKQLSLINRQLIQVHTLFIALTVFLMGVLCLTSATDLIGTSLGKKIMLGLALFWTVRLLIQFFGYSSRLWKGKIFETTIHIFFSLLWVYVSTTFWVLYFK